MSCRLGICHLLDPLFEQRPRIVRPGPCFWMELHRPCLLQWKCQALDGVVVERDVSRLTCSRRCDREAVVLARHEDPAGSSFEHRVVRTAVTERKFVLLMPRRKREQLVAEADAEDRHSPEEFADYAHLVDERLRIP